MDTNEMTPTAAPVTGTQDFAGSAFSSYDELNGAMVTALGLLALTFAAFAGYYELMVH